MSDEPRYLASSDQQLLLKAAFMDSEASRTSWAEWQGHHNLDDIDVRAYPLFPQLYLNLRAHGLDMSKHPRVQGIYRRCAYTNRLLLHNVRPALDALQRNGLRGLAVGPTASVVSQLGCYPLDRFHLAMDERTTVPAVELLNTLGWTTQHLHMPDEPVGLRGASNLENEQGDLMQIRWWSSCNADFWSSSVKVERDDFSLGVASSTDQLLDASVPGLNWHRVPFFLRVTHAMLVFRYAKGEVDWDRLTTDAHERQLVLALLDVLAYARELGACVPDIAMDRLRNTPVSTTEKYEYKYKIGRQTFMRRLGILWLNYRRVARRSANGGRNLRFVDYLRMRWRMGGLWELPRHVLGVIRRSFRGN